MEIAEKWMMSILLKNVVSLQRKLDCYNQIEELFGFLIMDTNATSSAEERKIFVVETSGAPLKIFQPVPVVINLASMHMTDIETWRQHQQPILDLKCSKNNCKLTM